MNRMKSEDLDALLAELDIGCGDCVCVHAFVPSLGVVDGGIAAIADAFLRRIGEQGTLIVPTFTASYRRGEIYDVKMSKSFNGTLSEYVRQQPGVVRSLCPLFSMAALGPDARRLMRRPTAHCFGAGSVYQNLFDADVKFVGLGIGWNEGYSFFMHLERIAGIPARREEKFYGRTRLADESIIDDSAVHFVRVVSPPWKRDRGRIAGPLIERGAMREARRDGCAHRTFYAGRLATVTLELLTVDPWCMTDRARRLA